MIMAGGSGELGDFVIENSLACVNFGDVPDLTGVSTREEMRETVRRSYSDASDGKVANVAGQLWALRSRVRPGDVVVMPLKKTSQIALGVVTGGYRYLDDPEAWWHHAVACRLEAHRCAEDGCETGSAVLARSADDRV